MNKYKPNYSRQLIIGKSPEEQYESRPVHEKITLKSGQLKLLITEIEFYTWLYQRKCTNVLYIGSAPGEHSQYIMEMFPTFKFVYYDGRPFHPQLSNYKNLTLINDLYTEESPIPFGGEEFAFVSDIRSGKEESYVKMDMHLQDMIIKRIKPAYSMLKFRLPWESGNTEYFYGQIYPQPYVGATSTETRLWIDHKTNGNKKCNYSNDRYNNMLYYYNKYTRLSWYKFDIIEDMDHCADCWIFKYVIENYIKICHEFMPHKTFSDYYKWFDYNLNDPPHGSLPDENDTVVRINKLMGITAQYHNKRIEQQNRMKEIYRLKDNMHNKYLADIIDKRSKLDDIELAHMGLYDYMNEIDIVCKYLNEHIDKSLSIGIVTDWAADYAQNISTQYNNMNFIFYYPHPRIPAENENLLIIYHMPRKSDPVKVDKWFLFKN